MSGMEVADAQAASSSVPSTTMAEVARVMANALRAGLVAAGACCRARSAAGARTNSTAATAETMRIMGTMLLDGLGGEMFGGQLNYKREIVMV